MQTFHLFFVLRKICTHREATGKEIPIFAFYNTIDKIDVYLLPLDHDKTTGTWKLSVLTYQTPGFSRVKELYDYLRSVGHIDPSNGRVEHLPYWIGMEAVEI
uniref:Uncharacterized protein n=1 Tax=Panagrolaimus sp. PS1159 TaxID=55785 RepID=A0AC35EZ45_9BILA